MNTRENQHIDPLAEKFRNYRPHSPKSDFGYFERMERQKTDRIGMAIMAALLLGMVMLLTSNIMGDYRYYQSELYLEGSHKGSKALRGLDGSQATTGNELPKKEGTVKKLLDVSYVPAGPDRGKPATYMAENSRRMIQESTKPDRVGYAFTRLVPRLEFTTPVFPLLLPRMFVLEDRLAGPVLPTPPGRTLYRFTPSIAISAGVNRTNQVVSSLPDAGKYVPSGYENYTKDALRPSYKVWFTAGIEFPLFSTTVFSTGLNYSQYGAGGEYNFTVDSFPVYDIDGSIAGYIHGQDEVNVNESSRRSFTYIQIPAGFKAYFSLSDNMRLAAGFNLSLGYLAQSKGAVLDESDYTSVKSLSTVPMRRFNISGSTSIGLMHSVNPRLDMGLQFSYNRMFYAEQKDTYYEIKNYGIGLAFTARYRLLKVPQ